MKILQKLVPVANEIASGICRKKAYEKLAKFREDNPGCGMGPAFFTKLIFFLGKNHDGYIMDQWTSLSVNFLACKEDRPIVKLRPDPYQERAVHTVTDQNSPEVYEHFCLFIEHIASRLGVTDAAKVEEWLFSRGGRQPAPWRKHVRDTITSAAS